ncbi:MULTISPECIES: HEPN domain-containing protein [unclassified Dehalobacter]|uniref:HEPN domain-containing protein n=1 Tax=unclassified Dehalobacter TaxID=2635733 RepID=UPI001FA9A74C|nr:MULTISPECIES: HEPN domain-containing protein [unclassified Dehalobacter]
MFETIHPKPLETVCYHCQQAAEKALSGIRTERGGADLYILLRSDPHAATLRPGAKAISVTQ